MFLTNLRRAAVRKFTVRSTVLACVGGLLGYVLFRPQSFSKFSSLSVANYRSIMTVPSVVPTFTDFSKWIDLKLVDVKDQTHNTKLFRFALPSESHVPGVSHAGFVIIKAPGILDQDGNEVTRAYTPVSRENQTGFLDLVIKRYPEGILGPIIFNLKVGDSLPFCGPGLKYPLKTNEFESVFLIGGGTGVAPMIQVARRILENPEDKTKIVYFDTHVSDEDVLLREITEKWAKEFPNQFQLVRVLERDNSNLATHVGRISPELLKKYIPAPDSGKKFKIFISGPKPLIIDYFGDKDPASGRFNLTGRLFKMGYSKEQVSKF
ncbi:NADH-cytochrome b5 reductase [Schizosaccharomyces japonicus yFS275]|uniref:NADH-cytochrome b5 reductase n=1 Tax=Schizosaccharomyces japonicus (strain yFS275 / FY16936) TaxID=402676 RepID=B6K2C7_SCHJY|nr:NADH-cytochrome b5 reductase [Schizosaccharomyces japonicus yFS275]EEB07308.1 NADH-cytochrome b5 reductase [Schizosaccharomyces japonicus yFS275]